MLRSLRLAALLCVALPHSPALAGNADPSAVVDAAQAMPAVRRIGVAPIVTNLDEYRRFLREDARSLTGFSALPLTARQASDELTLSLENALQQSGRFWTLAVDATVDVLTAAQTAPAMQSAREKLQKQYDLDGWLETDIRFSPDHTRIRVAMKGSRSPAGSIWAREDVLINSAPTTEDLKRAFHSAVARLVGTLAHDGRVTWQRGDLVVVDFGLERGVAKGQRLGGGYVVLSARHPVTQEFLRARRIPVLELEVIEARSGSSLCRIVRKNEIAAREAKGLLDGKSASLLLSWRADLPITESASRKDEAWGAEAGFPAVSKTPGGAPPPSLPPAREPPPATPTLQPEPPTTTPVDNPEPVAPPPEDADEPAPEMPSRGPEPTNPSSWRLREASFGLGMSSGGLDTSRGSRSTGAPSMLVNLLAGDAIFEIGPQLRLAPEASGAFYSGGDVEGEKLDVVAPVLLRVVGGEQPTAEAGTLDVGAGPALSAGSASTRILKAGRRVRVEQGFSAPDVFAQGIYSLTLPGLGDLSASLGLYALEIVLGEGSGTELKLLARPHAFLPKPLSFWVRGRLGPDIWSAGEIGVKWSLVQRE